MKQILVLFGGCSPEYSVSLASAYGVLTHMDRSLYQPIPVGITQEGAWRWYGGALEAIPEDRWQEEPACLVAAAERLAAEGSVLVAKEIPPQVKWRRLMRLREGRLEAVE